MAKDSTEQLLRALAEADNKCATKRGELKAAQQDYDAIADRVFALMEEQETEILKNTAAGLKVEIKEDLKEQVKDWAALTQFLRRNPSELALFQRRLSAPAVRDLLERRKGKDIPGIGFFPVRKLSVSKIS